MVTPREVTVIRAGIERCFDPARSVEVHRAGAASRHPRRGEAAMVTPREVVVIRARMERWFDLARSVEVHRSGNVHRAASLRGWSACQRVTRRAHPGVRGAVRRPW